MATLLVIANDCAAYAVGMTIGKKIFKRNLIDISPKKTWEGYLGGGIITIFVGVGITYILQQYTYLVCPVKSLTFTPFLYTENTCVMDTFFTTYNK